MRTLLLMAPPLIALMGLIILMSPARADDPPPSPNQTVYFTLVSQSDPNVYPRWAVYQTNVVFCLDVEDPSLLALHQGKWFVQAVEGKGPTFDLSPELRIQYDGLRGQNMGFPPTAIHADYQWRQPHDPDRNGRVFIAPALMCERQFGMNPNIFEARITWDQPIVGLGDLPESIGPVRVIWVD